MSELHYSINSIQREAYVKRLDVQRYGVWGGGNNIFGYDVDNLYPDKCRATAQRSNSLTTAIKTFSRFVSGQGFENVGNLEINETGTTLNDLLNFCSAEFAEFGIALHVKYNVFAEVVEVAPLRFEQVRKGLDDKYYVRSSWDPKEIYNLGLGYETAICLTEFDKEAAKTEIENVGFEKYSGQILYFHTYKNTMYPLARYDSVLDDAQFEADAKIYALSNIHNEFSASGAFKYPKSFEAEDEGKDVVAKLKGVKGEGNKGRFFAIGVPNTLLEKNISLFEPFQMQNIDKHYETLKKDSKNNIYELYQQPGIINGRTETGMFNAQSMQDAFDFYNSVTESDRQIIERLFSKIYPELIFKIKPLSFIQKTEDGNGLDIIKR
jgi:hypothetical protein